MNIDDLKLQNLIRESVNNILFESQGLKSRKVYDAFQEYGGLHSTVKHKGQPKKPFSWVDLHNITDNDVIGIFDGQELRNITNNSNLNDWAKENGYNIERGDLVEPLRLGDGQHYLTVIVRNADFEKSNREDGWKNYYNKTNVRRKNRLYPDDEYYPMTPKGNAAKWLRTNPYFKNKADGWSNDARREKAINYAKQGKDAWGNRL